MSFVEIHCDWIPYTLDYLEKLHRAGPRRMKLSPWEYWNRHCAVGASLMRYSDVAVRHQVGIDKMMFGSDYPHPEGTWPNTRQWLRTVVGDLPELEVRAILGENAVRFYDLDRGALVREARRYGPFVEDVLGAPKVSQELLDQFHQRSGINKEPSLLTDLLTQAVDEDLRSIDQISRP